MRDDDTFEDLEELRRIGGSATSEPVVWETPPPELWDRIAAAVVDDDEGPTDTPAVSTMEDARKRRRFLPPLWLAAAAVVAIVAVGVVALTRPSDDPSVVAEVDLELLGDSGEGSATLTDLDGALQLRLVTSGLADPDGFTEVWLINPDFTELVSLGPIRSDGTYDLPSGLDPAAFPIVDVSFEPLDGNPQHSGNSVLRGELTF